MRSYFLRNSIEVNLVIGLTEQPIEEYDLPICIAKTQYSISDDPKKLGFPRDYEITVRDVEVRTGSGFIIVYLGKILTMPGLPKVPNYESIDLDDEGNIVGIF